MTRQLWGLTLRLQWGRPASRAETAGDPSSRPDAGRFNGAALPAGRRPGHHPRGRGPQRASMGPPCEQGGDTTEEAFPCRRRPCFNGAALRAGRRLPVRNSLPSLPFSTTNSRDHQNRHIPGPVFNTYAVPRHHRSPPWHSEFSTLHARPGFRTARCRVISSHPITPTDPPTIPEIPRPCPRQCLAAPPRTSRSPIPQAIETSRNIPNPIALRPATSPGLSNPPCTAPPDLPGPRAP